jgi:23S rRNA pseudouridine1911/1915/1917 synthase
MVRALSSTERESIEFTILFDYLSLEIMLLDIFGVSKNKVKFFFSPKKKNKPIKKYDIISVPLNLIHKRQVNPIFEGKESPYVIEERDSFLTLHKPPQVHGHSLNYTDRNNCLSYLREHGYFPFLSEKFDTHEKSLLFRLDYETSGILVLSYDTKIHQLVRNNPSKVLNKKIYLALVEGVCQLRGVFYLKWNASGERNHLMKHVSLDSERFDFFGEIEIIDHRVFLEKDKTLLTIKLKEGHRHQIRIQLKSLGFPIVGDPLYGTSSDRMYLHAWKYELFVFDRFYLFQDDCFMGDLLKNEINFVH